MNGPRRYANGGFAAGTFADLVGGTATVTLHRKVPLARSFGVLATPDGLSVLDGDTPVASVRQVSPFVLDPPVRPTFAQAEEARRAHPFTGRRHALSTVSSAVPGGRTASTSPPDRSPTSPASWPRRTTRPRTSPRTATPSRRRCGVPSTA